MKHVRSFWYLLFVFFCMTTPARMHALASSPQAEGNTCAQASLQVRETGEPGKFVFDVASDKAIVSLRWFVISQHTPWTYDSGPRWDYTGTEAAIPFAIPFNGQFRVRVDVYHKTAPDQLCQVILDKMVEVTGLAPCTAGITAKIYGKAAYEFWYQGTPASSLPAPDHAILWDFGDGSTSTLSRPQHTYTQDGTYTVKLTRTHNGCTTENYYTLNVGCDKVKANILSEKYEGPGLYSFHADVTEEVKHWQWDFGDGGAWVNRWSVAYKYDYDGTYTVRYKATTIGGCVVRAEDVVTLTDAHLCGQPTLEIKETPKPGKFIYIIDSNKPILGTSLGIAGVDESWGYSSGTRWDWTGTHLELSPITFPNNGPAKVGVTCSFEYAPGKYCYTDLDDGLAITGNPCTASINTERQGETHFKFTLTGKNIGKAGTGTTLWEFGDGNTSTDFQGFHSYAAAGQYIVKATRSYYGCTAVAYDTVTVCISGDVPIQITQGAAAGEYHFSAESSDIITDAYWAIDTDDSNIWFGEYYDLNTTIHQVSHRFDANGTYYLWCYLFTREGCYLEGWGTLEVNDAEPENCGESVASINAQKSGPGRYDLSVTSADNVRAGFVWDFGNGKSSTLLHPSYQYGENGTYTVTFKGTTTGGCPLTASTTLTVTDALSCGKASLLVSETGAPGKFTFTIRSERPVLGTNFDISGLDGSWAYSSGTRWDYHGTEIVINHTIPSNGPFRVNAFLQYENASHCAVSLTDTVVVRGHACAAAVTSSRLGEARYRFRLTGKNTGTAGTGTTLWEFGDGATSTEFQPLHTYARAGTFIVKATRSYYGCTATAYDTVRVCFGGEVPMRVESTPTWGEYSFAVSVPERITEAQWSIYNAENELWSAEFTDLDSTGHGVVHRFATKGIYTAWVYFKTDHGCYYEAHQTLEVSDAQPETPGCDDVKASINAHETAPGTYSFTAGLTAPFVSDFTWDFGNGQTSTDKDPRYQYPKNGAYVITFSCRTGGDCAIRAQHTLVVTGVPENITTGTGDNEVEGLAVYPNPSDGRIYFSEPVTGVIYDATGKLVLRLEHEETADLKEEGLYYVRPQRGRAVKVIVK